MVGTPLQLHIKAKFDTVPLALFTGLVLPTLIAATWGDAMGGYIWGGLVARVLGMLKMSSSWP
jgi:fatty-acid desaturase